MKTNSISGHSHTACCKIERVPQAGFMQRFRAQFGKPTGFWGKVAGWIMAHRPSNRTRNAWAVSLLNIQPSDRVLEIGFGPGWAIELMSRLATDGQVVGIDHSEVMLQQAEKRNAAAIEVGRVKLWLGSVGDLPGFDDPFDKILAVNSMQFWEHPVAQLGELRRHLKPGGRIALAFQPRWQGATEDDAHEAGRDMVDRLTAAGFKQVRLEIKPIKPISVVCVLGLNEA